MKTLVTLSIVTLCSVQVPRALADPDARIEVDVGHPGIRMSKQLWGIFFEEINFAGDGGIYAELVRHRAFEDVRDPLAGWSLVRHHAVGEMDIDPEVRLNDVRKQSLRVDVQSVDAGGSLGVANSGYWGIPVREATPYAFSLFVRGDEEFAGSSLRVSLRDRAMEKIYAEHTLSGVGAGWRKKTCTLVPEATDRNGRLVISTGDTGTFWLSMVSLFPPTWKNQPNGLRPDLVKLLADLQPSFFRFPGGCFAEGHTLQDTFLFKETVGPVEERKGRPCFWGYRSSDGLGYYEYLRLAEDLGANAIFCINPGANNGVTQVIAMSDLAPWLQTAVDAVEFAVGSPDSPWGARRAAMGHPEPFAFETFYLQIGNETEFGYEDYVERFRAYRDRVKSAFPGDNVKVIADSWGLKGRQTVDAYAIDYHRYTSWQDAIRGRDQYDESPRGKPFVFKGEYATRNASGILQALSEAVYMMGLEENSDEVVMAAYAPLFANVNGTQWRPDLIYFDNHRSMGTISYWVQQMFSTNRGDRLLPLDLEEVREPSGQKETLAGSIGVGSWNTEVEYRNIRVVSDGKTLYESESFDPDRWTTLNGDWNFDGDVLRQSSGAVDCRAWLKGPTWSRYQLRLQARKIRGAEGFLIMFHVRGADDYVWANFGGWQNRQHAVERADEGSKVQSRRADGRIESGRWYNVRIDVDGNDVVCRLDGDVVCTADLGRLAPEVTGDLYATACTDDSAGEIVVKVVNIAETAKRVSLSFGGVTGLRDEATAITLQAGDRGASQSLDAPLRYSPRRSIVRGVSSEFEYVFEPCSLTVLRLK